MAAFRSERSRKGERQRDRVRAADGRGTGLPHLACADRGSGGATGERSLYGPLSALIDAVGSSYNPRSSAFWNPPNRVPDIRTSASTRPDNLAAGTFDGNGQLPERGTVEIKALEEEALRTAAGPQVERYRGRYGLMPVTNGRGFVLVGDNASGTARRA